MAGDDEASLVRRADEACYLAKERGKNCVVMADLPG
jgi:GGDEF domain-containing protein